MWRPPWTKASKEATFTSAFMQNKVVGKHYPKYVCMCPIHIYAHVFPALLGLFIDDKEQATLSSNKKPLLMSVVYLEHP